MSLEIDFDLEDAGARRMLHDLTGRLNRPEHLLDVLVDKVHEYERDVFASGGNGAWPALSPATVALKGSGQILVDSGSLLDALTSSEDLMGDAAEVTAASVPYAHFHKTGTGRMPARDPAPEPDSGVVEGWAHTLLDEITGGVL